MTKTLALLLALAFPAVAFAQAPCSKADAAKAEKAVDRISTWPQMQKAFKEFGHCDAGPVDDVFTESLIRLIVEWKNVDAFAACMQDAGFKAFVMKHLRSPAAKDDLDSVYSRAKASCPAKQETLCAELAEAAKAASAK
jgi:hypothetical protein